MKKLLAILSVAAICATACHEKEGLPTIGFNQQLGTIYAGTSSTPVELVMSVAQSTDVAAGILLTYTTDTNVSSSAEQTITFPAGEVSVILDVPNVPDNLAEGATVKSINVKLTTLPLGFDYGYKSVYVLEPSDAEAVVCSMAATEANLIESLKLKVKLSGTVSGNDWVASNTTTIPVNISGEGAAYVSCDGVINVEAGDNYGTITIKAAEGIHDLSAPLTISLSESDSQYIVGDNAKIEVVVRGLPTAETLAGTWNFVELVDAEDVEYFYEEMEDEFELCPVNNEGFSLNFSEKDGGLYLTPSSSGDFAAYYRNSAISLSAPKNTVSNSVVLGSYSAQEDNMFVSMIYDNPTQEVYFKLASANRSFDNSAESLGEGTISISFVSDDQIIVTIHDYDEPPFAFIWWDTPFDPEMLGFASLFQRQK